jgi:hypothetical protein
MRTAAELEHGLEDIRRAPRERGTIELITRRPAIEQRDVVEVAELDTTVGLVGDCWSARPSNRTPDRTPHPDMQLTLMSVRVIRLISPDRWELAGDQLYVDLDLSDDHLPPGTRLALGTAMVEVTDQPHTGCAKFSARFGSEVMRWVNSPVGRALNLRGINTRVLVSGTIRRGDAIQKA